MWRMCVEDGGCGWRMLGMWVEDVEDMGGECRGDMWGVCGDGGWEMWLRMWRMWVEDV